jgi:hypothetical protein
VAAAVATAAAEDMAVLPAVEVAMEAAVAVVTVLPVVEEATEEAAVNTEVAAVVNTEAAVAVNTEAAAEAEAAMNKEARIWEPVSRTLTLERRNLCPWNSTFTLSIPMYRNALSRKPIPGVHPNRLSFGEMMSPNRS